MATVAVVFILHSCIYVVNRREAPDADSGIILTNDTLNALSLPDNNNVDTGIRDTVIMLPPANGKRINTGNVNPEALVQFAETLKGVPYKYGSTDPRTGFDCSGFITYVFNHFNLKVPRSSVDFSAMERSIELTEAKRGDIVLFTGTNPQERTVGHMGIVVSNNNGLVEFIHSTSGKAHGVTVSPLSDYYKTRYMRTIRVFPQNDSKP